MTSILITGGAGFIGSHLVEELIERDYDVRILDNLSKGSQANLSKINGKIDFIKGDITEKETLSHAMKGIEYVFHLAAITSVKESIENPFMANKVNEVGTLNVLESARKSGIKRIINASSASVYGGIEKNPKKEDMVPRPLSPYATSKISSEYYLESFHHLYGLECVNLRYFNIYGPRQNFDSDYAAVVPIFIERLLSNERPEIHGDGNQTRDFVFVKDIVKANIISMDKKNIGYTTLNIGSGMQVSINELFNIIRNLTEKDIEPKYTTAMPGDPRISMADISLAKKTIGYSPKYDLEKGLEITIEWFRTVMK